MSIFGEQYHTAVQKIQSAQLPAIEISALFSFVHSAVVPNDAGRYVLQQLSENPRRTLEETLRSIREDWMTLALKRSILTVELVSPDEVPCEIKAALNERDGHRCRVTGSDTDVKPTYIVAPSVVHDADLRSGGYLRPLLDALVSSKQVEEMLEMLKERNQRNELRNLWLMAQPVRTAFRYGSFKIHKPPYLETPSARIPNVKNDGWQIQAVPPTGRLPFTLDGHGSFYTVPSTPNPDTHLLPARVLLNIQGIISIPLHFSVIEQQIRDGWPPITQGREHTANEANALLLVERYTSINAPRLIDSVMSDNKSGFILMTTITGNPLNLVFYRTTYEEREQIGKDLAEWIQQLRRIPNQTNYLIANTLGGPISDHRYGQGEAWGHTIQFQISLIDSFKMFKGAK
ncbi:predicted protein [Uncinocarpus reesii 1704]|uniref:Uncharacterized protein n=1 Tax=Uncinocarpus reesii (strain UAMH 1704) TaxID=336963 RepID=C4JI35_UNCRE|nr:uncharacterized protein UREG_01460 [Uncinocarpus reesii 1704]EEP76611.1 predicted protein [Uncinocarpus reesii 1704]